MKSKPLNRKWALVLAIGGWVVWQDPGGMPAWAGQAPGRPAGFKPFAYELSTERLAEQFSAAQMQRAEGELKQIQAVNEKGPWKPTWDSLDQHHAPEWFLDAKLGVMLNWGMHSVPAWDKNRGGAMYPDAYGCEMYRDGVVMPHHAKFWGADFQWDDCLPLFKAERYDPNTLVSLFEEAGARYLITMSKHHDGLAWWDSQWTRRNTVQMGPKKDLLTPLMAAAKKRDLKVVLYFCYEEWATAMLGADDKPCYRIWNWGSYAGLHPLTPESRRRVSGNIPVKNYYDQYMTPLVKEMIERFDPDGLWMDGEWATPAETLRSRDLAAYFYNKAEGRKEVTINDRLGQGTRDRHGDYFASEYNSTQSYTHPWEENQGISQSFAYNYEDNEESLGPPARLIHRFITIVSKNGNLVIIGGPDASGVYPENVVRRFKALGAWLKVNGEAIYATRILPPYQEGSTSYTRSKDGKFAYAICKEWPGKSLTLTGVRTEDNARITMLGTTEPLSWQQTDQGLTIAIPEAVQDEKIRPCQHAWAIKIPMQPKVVIARKNFAAPVTLSAWGLCDRVVYTLDASEPAANSTVYAGPVALPGGVTTLVKARCMRGGNLVGQTAFGQFQGSPPVPPKPDVYLDTLEPASFRTGWQAPGVKTWRNVNCHGQPLKVCGDTFARGVGMHANGEAVLPVKPEYKQWVCRVGIDDAAGTQGSVVVRVFLDEKLICQTPVLSGGNGLWNLNASLEGATDQSRLKIVIEDNGDGIQGDNVDLMDAGFLAQQGQAQVNYYNAPPEAVEAWRQWKFGMHVQWNPSVLRGGEISWSRRGAGAALHQGAGLDPEYDNYYKKFKAEKFNAVELCKILKDAGMRFSTFCNKHHDGFSMWDTKLSDYKITSPECPAGRDFTREWAEACRATGLKYALYPSQPDWIDPDYLRSPEAHARYIRRLHGWIRELCANYGTVDAIEFDGLGGLACNWASESLFKMIRELQPNVVINSRCGAYDVQDWPAHVFMPHSVEGTRNLPFTRGFPGDFDTPESWQGGMEIDRPQFDRPWETCSPLQKGQWQYNGNREFMSAREVLQLLINIVGRDGNLMMCVGIKPDGTFDERHVAVLREVGQWLRKYGETIYETRGGPYFPTTHGVATYHGNKIFLHLLQWPGDKLVLPPIQRKLVGNAVLTGGKAEVAQDEKGAISVSVSKEHRRDIDTIVALTLDAPAKGAKPGRFALGSLATGKKVRASNVYSGQPYFAPEHAVDDDSHTRWATDFATKQAWLEVDLGEVKEFNTVLIKEDLGLVRKFEVQIQKDGNWVAVVVGRRIGDNYRVSFPTAQSRRVRLSILDAVAAPQFPTRLYGLNSHMAAFPGPTFWEFQVLLDPSAPPQGSAAVVSSDSSIVPVDTDDVGGMPGVRRKAMAMPDVLLDDLPMLSMKSGNEQPEKKTQLRKNCTGQPLRLGGTTYERGIGDHAGNGFAAELVYALKPEYQRFVSLVGIDDQTAGKGSAIVKLLVDDQLILQTLILRGEEPPQAISLKLPQGVKQLKLLIEDAGDGYGYDDVDFVNAGFLTTTNGTTL